jgi:glycerophosphoryl diester phosphodiesterase
MLLDMRRPAVIAHRGASADAPENTMAAFALAVKAGADAIELDAQLTADDELVVFHDATLSRTTDGRGRIADKTLAELADLDAGGYFGASYRGERIPHLVDVLDTFGAERPFNIHVKSYPGSRPGLVASICELIRHLGAQRRVFLSSFSPTDLSQAAKMIPEVPRWLLAPRGWLGAWARSFGFSFGDYAALNPHYSDVSPQQVLRVHRLSRRLNAWTVNTPSEIVRLAAWGVDGILTDDLRPALRALERAP